jgi:hypothetical protein
VGAPGAHGPGVFGMQGMGVRTPIAADVAAATSGFPSDIHIPNDGMLAMGKLSEMFASGASELFILCTDTTSRLAGAMPKLHRNVAP